MTNSYFEQLKQTYETPAQAFKAYHLQKNLWKVGNCSAQASDEVKASFEIQEKINEYCEELVHGNNPGLLEKFNLTTKDVSNFFNQYDEHFQFIGIDYSLFINLISGMHAMNIDSIYNKQNSWETLEQLMTKEGYTVSPQNKVEVQEKMKTTCQECGLMSILVSQAKSQISVIDEINQGFEQLSQVVGCNKSQIGMNQYNVAIDTEENTCAGYSNHHFREKVQKLFLNSLMKHDAFAHEWLHGMDNILAQQNKTQEWFYSDIDQGKIKTLLDAGARHQDTAIAQIKTSLSQKSITYCHNIIDRYDHHIQDPQKLKKYLDNHQEKLFHDKFDAKEKKEFIDLIKKHMGSECPLSFSAYLVTEIEMTQHLNTNADMDKSLFMQYAKQMDNNLQALKIDINSDYSVSNSERFARMFETYCDIKLKEKGLDNVISYIDGNSYTPRPEETRGYLEHFDKVTQEFKRVIDDICPLKVSAPHKHDVLSNIQNLRSRQKEPEYAKLKK